MYTLQRIDLAQIPATHATDQQPITLHYGQHFTARHHQRAYSHYPTAASEIIHSQDFNKKDEKEPLQVQKHNCIKQFERQSVKQRSNSVHKILTVRQIKQATRNLQKMSQKHVADLANQSQSKQSCIELGGPCNKKRIQLSKYLQPLSRDLPI